MKQFNAKISMMAFLGIMSLPVAAQQKYYDNIVVTENNRVAFTGRAAVIDSIAMENGKKQLALYDKNGQLLFSAPAADCKMQVEKGAPIADMLDVVFNEDGTATDASAMANEIKVGKKDGIVTYYNDTFKRYVAQFNNVWAGAVSGYYRVDYGDNDDFLSRLQDGHTLEAVVMANYEEPIVNGEAKFFSSHEAGGTGLMVCKTSKSRGNELTFLPNVSETGKSSWKWATSGIVPQPQQYYHIVGVWDKEASKAYVYVNGELKNTVDAVGDMVLPKANSRWFAIGCDSGPSEQLGWSGDVVLARIYDAALTPDDVQSLWSDVQNMENNAPAQLVSDVQCGADLAVKAGCMYPVVGKGFKNGDVVRMQKQYDASKTFDLPCTLTDKGVSVKIPEGIATGTYLFTLVRGQQRQQLGSASIVVMQEIPAGAKVIAHRGAWNTTDASQNSVASLKKALDMHIYGSETDVWMTTDGHLMVNHDPTFNGVRLETATYDQVKNLRLKNGELMPQLSDFLKIMQHTTSPTKLVIELKAHSTDARNIAAAKAIVAAVKAAGIEDKVEYISFSLTGCKAFCKAAPKAKIAYLNGGIAPAELKKDGITGLDYHMSEFRKHPEWIEQAHKLGMTVNVWTLNTANEVGEMTNKCVDYVTTNAPQEAVCVKSYYDKASKVIK